MRAGELDRRISIQTAVTSNNSLNEPIETWTQVGTVWAKMTPVSDGERLRAGEVAAQITIRFLIRWSTAMADVTPKDRLIFEGKTYDIFHIKEVGRHVGLEISAAARADQ